MKAIDRVEDHLALACEYLARIDESVPGMMDVDFRPRDADDQPHLTLALIQIHCSDALDILTNQDEQP